MPLERYSADEAQKNAFARVLLLGPPKCGKTVACSTTSPRPVDVINCDGKYAIAPVPLYGKFESGDFEAMNVRCNAEWQAACREEHARACKGEVRTIVVDSLTLLADSILDEARQARPGAKLDFDGWSLYADAVMGHEGRSGLRLLLDAPAHLIITAHMAPVGDYVAGILPAIPGRVIPNKLPGLIDDWILFECTTSGERRFVLGPQDNWNHSGRNIRKVTKIAADVNLLLKELGIDP